MRLPQKQNGKLRMESLNVNLGRSGLPQESLFPSRKQQQNRLRGPNLHRGAKPAARCQTWPEQLRQPRVLQQPKAAPRRSCCSACIEKGCTERKMHYFILENLCVGCGLCLDKCPPKVQAIGYKFYGDVQEGGFRGYIDQDACISCSACFSSDECPSGALVEVLPDGEVLDFTYTPPERLDFDLRFLHRFHREAR